MGQPLFLPQQQKPETQVLPPLVWVVAITTLIADMGGVEILGYQVSAVGWLVPLVWSLYVLIHTPGRIRFPYFVWLPWIGLVLLYLFVANAENVIQRSVMLLVPIVVGMAVSQYDISEETLESFDDLCGYSWKALWIIVAFKSGLEWTGALPVITGLAAESMTACLLAVVFAAQYAIGRKASLPLWVAMAFIPVVALTRTTIVAVALTLPLTFAPLGARARAISLVIICFLGIGLFYTERVQNKMFYSGEGTISDVSRDNPDFATTGRRLILDEMEGEIERSPSPWWGFGANASEEFVSRLTDGLTHPHNDWLRIVFDYGYFGAIVFAMCLVLQSMHALRRALTASGHKRLLFYAGASSFVIFILIMFTDNIILYAAFFGNFQFMILGLAYSGDAQQPENIWLSQSK